ncbi:MAG: condensation domain-containing protein, partial [Bacteroidota bacterium]
SRIKEQFAIDLSLATLIKSASLKDQAKLIENSAGSEETLRDIPKQLSIRPPKIPLSFSQERLWFIHEFGQSKAYHIPGVIELNEIPDLKILNESINFLIARHESLRTCFYKNKGEVYQRVLDKLEIKVAEYDLTDLESIEKKARKERILEDLVEQPFDLQNGPLIRVMVIKTGSEEAILGYCMHHIILDGWSLKIFSEEMNEVSGQLKNGEKPYLPELPIQYIDYAVWQHEYYTEDMIANDLEHWKNHLEGYEKLAFPTDFRRPEILSGAGSRVIKLLDKDVVNKARQVSMDNEATSFAGLMSCVYALLYNYSG